MSAAIRFVLLLVFMAAGRHPEVVARLKGLAEKFATELGDENRPGRGRAKGRLCQRRPTAEWHLGCTGPCGRPAG